MTNKAVVLATALLLASNAVADSNFLCITDQVSGFFHDTNKDTWEQVNFLPGERFTISKLTQNSYRLRKSGDKNTWTAIAG